MKNQLKTYKRVGCAAREKGGLTLKGLKKFWAASRDKIETRLKEFRDNWRFGGEERIFSELAFCLFTPQSKAVSCAEAVVRLSKDRLLFEGGAGVISKKINIVRFRNNKARYLVEARDKFTSSGKLKIKERLAQFKNVFEERNWLVKNVKGLGMKEASHFLRNIGFGGDIAILDRHILKNLMKLKVIRKIPSSINEKTYLSIEKKMKKFSKKVKIPLEHLDLLFWARETGYIFK